MTVDVVVIKSLRGSRVLLIRISIAQLVEDRSSIVLGNHVKSIHATFQLLEELVVLRYIVF